MFIPGYAMGGIIAVSFATGFIVRHLWAIGDRDIAQQLHEAQLRTMTASRNNWRDLAKTVQKSQEKTNAKLRKLCEHAGIALSPEDK